MSLRHILFSLDLFPSEAERENSQKQTLALLEALTLCNQFYLKAHPETPLLYQSGVVYKVPAQFQSPEDDSALGRLMTLVDKYGDANDRRAINLIRNQVGGENFRDIPRILENGGGDCDNLASFRCAELRQKGIYAKPYITWRKRPDGGTTYHVIVRWPDGTSEDPSLLLGMQEHNAGDRDEEIRKLAERTDDFINGAQTRARAILEGAL